MRDLPELGVRALRLSSSVLNIKQTAVARGSISWLGRAQTLLDRAVCRVITGTQEPANNLGAAAGSPGPPREERHLIVRHPSLGVSVKIRT